MRIAITGAAGFIGSHLSDALLQAGHSVVGIDNLSTGRKEFLANSLAHPEFLLRQFDLLDQEKLNDALVGIDYVFHLAANADVRHGLRHPRKDYEQNVVATQNVLEAMRKNSCRRISFSSTGSVYGEPDIFPTPETCPFPTQTSLYGASKLSAEALISAYCEGYGFDGRVYRFVSILGPRYSHGHVFDFVKSLRANPKELRVLGNGQQRKSYLNVQDCVCALVRGLDQPGKFEIFNLGTNEYVTVDQSVRVICDTLGLHPEILHTGGERGWTGDSPFIFLACDKIRATGWEPRHSIVDSVKATTRYLQENPWLLHERAP